MGFENREYYREDEGGGFMMAGGGLGTACKTLIAVNIGVFLLQILSTAGPSSSASEILSFDSALIAQGQIWRLFSWGFGYLDGQPLGFIFDMLFIWWFGKSMETMYGTRELLLFYATTILLGSAIGMGAALGGDRHVAMMGSSAPAMAITVLFAYHFPYRQILLFFLIPVPIFALVALYVVMNLYGGAQTGFTAGPFIAGLTAVAFGLLYAWRDWRIERLLPGQGIQFRVPRRKPDLRVFEPEDTQEVDREVDRILIKIHEQGEASLTAKERKTLQQASRRYRR